VSPALITSLEYNPLVVVVLLDMYIIIERKSKEKETFLTKKKGKETGSRTFK
jgi:hypothetical protein